MSIELSLDLTNATVAELATFLEAVEATGTSASTALRLEANTLKITATPNPGARSASQSNQRTQPRGTNSRTPSAETQALQWLADRINEFRPNER